jgi:hypothetical protein
MLIDYVTLKISDLHEFGSELGYSLERRFDTVTIKKILPSVDIAETENEWYSCRDISYRKRDKQTIYKKRFRMTCTAYETPDMDIFEVSETVEMRIYYDNGQNELLNISEISVERKNNVEEQLAFYEITYTVDSLGVVMQPLLSENIENQIGLPNKLYNKITVIKNNPEFAQRCLIYYDTDRYSFELDVNEYTNYINVGETYAVHAQNIDLTNGGNLMTGIFEVKTKNTTKIKFSDIDPSGTIGNLEDVLTIDNIPENSIYASYMTNKQITFDIYSIINPKLSILSKNGEDVNLADGINIVENISFTDVLEMPFFLKTENLWKYKCLLLGSKITLTTQTGTYVTTVNSDIASISENDYLDMKEFMLRMPVTNITMRNGL